jgi:hypothetical protein
LSEVGLMNFACWGALTIRSDADHAEAVIASEAKQSMASPWRTWIASPLRSLQ